MDTLYRCTECGQVGTVGRCCGNDTREPLNELARADMKMNDTWVCKCGAEHTMDTLTSKWRWTGTAWEHYHGYPIGHVPAHLKTEKTS